VRSPTMFASFLSWQPAFNRSVAEQIALYQQPAFRDAFLQELASRKREHIWDHMRVLDVHTPALEVYRGKTVLEIAAMRGTRPVDAYLDIAIADALQTHYQGALFNYDQAGVERLVTEDRFLIGLSDGGAHVECCVTPAMPQPCWTSGCGQRQALTLEQAIHKLTAVPAALFGIPSVAHWRWGRWRISCSWTRRP